VDELLSFLWRQVIEWLGWHPEELQFRGSVEFAPFFGGPEALTQDGKVVVDRLWGKPGGEFSGLELFYSKRRDDIEPEPAERRNQMLPENQTLGLLFR